MTDAKAVTISVSEGVAVSGLLTVPPDATACLVLAHGAGAGMTHPFMIAVANGLAQRGIGCLRYQFPYMEAGSKRPDRPALATAAVRSAVSAAVAARFGIAVFAGGKSFGGRMTSLAQATTPLPLVRGLVFLEFPLHPAGKPAIERAAHLAGIAVPMLFVQGTRDTLADLALLRPVTDAIGPRATLLTVDGADHGFHVPVRSGRSDAAVLAGILDATAAWMRQA